MAKKSYPVLFTMKKTQQAQDISKSTEAHRASYVPLEIPKPVATTAPVKPVSAPVALPITSPTRNIPVMRGMGGKPTTVTNSANLQEQLKTPLGAATYGFMKSATFPILPIAHAVQGGKTKEEIANEEIANKTMVKTGDPGGPSPVAKFRNAPYVTPKASPISYSGVGEMAGSTLPWLGLENIAGKAVGKYAPRLGELASTAIKGGVAGGVLAGTESATSGQRTPLEVAKDTAVGTIMGGGLNLALGVFGKAVTKMKSGEPFTPIETKAIADHFDLPVTEVPDIAQKVQSSKQPEVVQPESFKQPTQQVIKQPTLTTTSEIKTPTSQITAPEHPLNFNLQQFQTKAEPALPIKELPVSNVKESKVLTELPKKANIPLKQRAEDLYQMTISSDLPHEQAGKLSPDVRYMANVNKRSAGSVDYNLSEHGAQTDITGKPMGKSLFQIFKDVNVNDKQALFEHAYHNLNVDRMNPYNMIKVEERPQFNEYVALKEQLKADPGNQALKNRMTQFSDMKDYFEKALRGKPIFGEHIGAAESKKAMQDIQATNPKIAEKNQEIVDYGNNLMEGYAVKSGLITQEGFDNLKGMYENYVPAYRVKDAEKLIGQGSATGNVANVIKKAKGGTDDILPLDQQMAVMTNKIIKASRKNELYNAWYDAFEQNPDKIGKWFTVTSKEKQDITGGVDEITKPFDEPIQKFGDTYQLNFYRNGEKVQANISKSLYEAIKPMQEVTSLEGVTNIIRKYATNPFKALITTYNPLFIVSNIMRDIPTALINAHDTGAWAKNMPTALKEIVSDGSKWKEFQSLGGTRSGIFNYEKGVKTPFMGQKTLPLVKGAQKVLDKVEFVTNITETLPRFAEYLATVEKGGNTYKSKLEGIMRSAEITTDFARNGKLTKTLDSVVPYLNPGVQGVDKFARQLIEHPIKTVASGALFISAPTLMLDYLNKNDPDYINLNEKEKNNYFHIKMPDGKFARIPKSREFGVVFSSLVEWLARTARGEKIKPSDIADNIASNFAPASPIDNSIITPIMKAWRQVQEPKTDVKTALGASIVPTALKHFTPKEQYDQYTSGIAKELGQVSGVSPKVIDYMLRSYGGIIAQTLLPKTSAVNRGVVATKFITDPVFASDSQNRFYTLLDDKTQQLNNIKRDAAGEKLTGSDLELQQHVTELNRASRQIGALRTQQKQIDASTYSNQEKEQKIRDLQKQMNEIADSMTNYTR